MLWEDFFYRLEAKTVKQFESNVQYMKYLVNKEAAKHFFQGSLEGGNISYRAIAEEMIPGTKATFACCVYKEQHIMEERLKLTVEPAKDNRIINVLSSACDECPIDRFVVTEACRGCLGHKCQEVCPRNAITIVNHRAYINQNLCIECGRCKAVCPFNAISEVKRPCVRACSVGAVTMDENKKAMIDHEKCITCGACVYQCPFGAIVDKSFILDVLRYIGNSWNNTNYHVYAVIAPSISSQFPEVSMGQMITAIKHLGFFEVVEAAVGADMVALHEAKEFAETVEEKGWKTTSCCPAFVTLLKQQYPQFMDHISETVSPMVAIARGIKAKDAKAKVIFIGPCIAKKAERKEKDIKDAVDVVITFEELRALIDAKGIEVAHLKESNIESGSYYGRVFGRIGGVTEGVIQALQVQKLDVAVKGVKCNGIDECLKSLKLLSFGKQTGNFMEAMACKNGCTGGAASVSHDAKGIGLVNQYGKEAKSKDSFDAIQQYPIEKIKMKREWKN